MEEEIEDLSNTLADFIKDANEKISEEKEVMKKQYNENLKKLMNDLKTIQEKFDEKEMQIEELEKGNKLLEEDISRLQRENIINNDDDSKFSIYKSNLESAAKKLLDSEHRLMQMSSDRDQAQMKLGQMTEIFNHERKILEKDKLNAMRNIETLQNELSISKGYIKECVVQIETLNSQIARMEEDIKIKITHNEKKYENILTRKVQDMRTKYTVQQNELEKHLRLEHRLNKRWKEESRYIVKRLNRKIEELKTKNARLQSKIKERNSI